MKRVHKMIYHFEMMGYDVRIIESLGCIEVSLSTNSRYRVNRRVTFDELDKDFVIEQVVGDLNKRIIMDM